MLKIFTHADRGKYYYLQIFYLYRILKMQTAVTAYSSSKQLLLFVFYGGVCKVSLFFYHAPVYNISCHTHPSL